MNSRRKHTSPKNKKKKNGWDPPSSTHTWVRQIVAGSMCHIDRQIVAWAMAHGRRAQGHRLRQKKAQVRHIADLILNLKMRSSNYVKFNKWRKYDSRPRKSERDQRFDLETCSRSKSNEKKDSSNFWSMASFVCIRLQSKWNDQEGGQRWTIGPLPLTKLFLVSKSSPRKNLSQDGNHQLLAFGHCSWTTEQRQKSESLVDLSLIELKLKPGNYLKNFTKKNRINSFPPDPGREIAWGFFVTIIINNRIRPQAHN